MTGGRALDAAVRAFAAAAAGHDAADWDRFVMAVEALAHGAHGAHGAAHDSRGAGTATPDCLRRPVAQAVAAFERARATRPDDGGRG